MTLLNHSAILNVTISSQLLTKKLIVNISPGYTSSVEFENGGFNLKTHKMFSVHATPEKFERATITDHFGFMFDDHFGFVFDENSDRKIK